MSATRIITIKVYSVRVQWAGRDLTGFVRAKSRSAARYTVWKSARDAGYCSIEFHQIRILRAPEYDGSNIMLGSFVSDAHAGLKRQEVEKA